MKNNWMSLKLGVLILISLFTLMSTSVYADRDERGHRDRDRDARREPPPKDYRLDDRYRHNQYYPSQGAIINTLPERRYPLRFHDRNYFYFGGVWYSPAGSRFVVVAPPIGIVVPILPPFYTTIWLGGIPYYYANDSYYVWRPDLNGYQVTNPPSESSSQEPKLTADQLFIYPQKGQSEQQQADDRYECYRWSVSQTGYDPTQPPENLSQSTLNSKREDYQRAMKACLEGRGYSVR